MNEPNVTDSPAAPPVVAGSNLLADLVAEYLACDGSHSMYDMLALMDVRPKIVEIIGVERIIKQRHKRLNQITG